MLQVISLFVTLLVLKRTLPVEITVRIQIEQDFVNFSVATGLSCVNTAQDDL